MVTVKPLELEDVSRIETSKTFQLPAWQPENHQYQYAVTAAPAPESQIQVKIHVASSSGKVPSWSSKVPSHYQHLNSPGPTINNEEGKGHCTPNSKQQ